MDNINFKSKKQIESAKTVYSVTELSAVFDTETLNFIFSKIETTTVTDNKIVKKDVKYRIDFSEDEQYIFVYDEDEKFYYCDFFQSQASIGILNSLKISYQDLDLKIINTSDTENTIYHKKEILCSINYVIENNINKLEYFKTIKNHKVSISIQNDEFECAFTKYKVLTTLPEDTDVNESLDGIQNDSVLMTVKTKYGNTFGQALFNPDGTISKFWTIGKKGVIYVTENTKPEELGSLSSRFVKQMPTFVSLYKDNFADDVTKELIEMSKEEVL